MIETAIPQPSETKNLRGFAWLDSAEGLRDANQSLGGMNAFKTSSEEAVSGAREILKNEFGFIDNPDFHKPRAGAAIFRKSLGLQQPYDSPSKSSLPAHFERLCETPLLKQEQEQALFERMNFLVCKATQLKATLDLSKPCVHTIATIRRLLAMAKWHRDRIVEANLRLVFSIVKKFVNPTMTFDDLLGEGIMALIRAVEKFDYARGFRFSTYATQVVRRHSYKLVVDQQTDHSRCLDGFEEMGIEIPEVQKDSAIAEQRWHSLRAKLNVLLEELDRREKLIIRCRFSLGSHRRVHTLQSIANRLGVSKERVRQIEKRALEKLQELAQGSDLIPDVV